MLRGTGAHNTLLVDGVDQAVADEPFSWTHIPTTQAENWIVGKTFTYFVGSHNGYTRLEDPVVHRRHVLKIADDLWLVRDIAIGRTEHELEIRWHFAPDLEVRVIDSGRIEVSRAGTEKDEPVLSLIAPQIVPQTAWPIAMEVSKTLLSPAYGAFQPAPLVRCAARVLLPAETATALLPRCTAIQQENEPDTETRLTSAAQPAVQAYKLDYHEKSHGFFFALGSEAWSSGPWSSDAQVLYCCVEEEKLTHLVVVGGTHVAWQGQPLLKAEPSKFFEWRMQDGMTNSSSGGSFVTSLFEQLTGNSRSSSVDMNHISSSYAEKH
jgi:hypothetical protein